MAVSFVPGATAVLNKPHAFQPEFSYMRGLDANGELAVVSGELEATLVPAPGSFGFFDSPGLTISGLDRVCWGNQCDDSPSRALTVTVAAGGSFALCFPTQPTARVEADHALGMFSDLAQDDDLNSFRVGKSLVAPVVGGVLTFGTLASVPSSGLSSSSLLSTPCNTSAGLAALDDQTRVVIKDGATTLDTLAGKEALLLFTGQPRIPAVEAGFLIAPFGSGSHAHFEPAGASAAGTGLDIQRVQSMFQRVDASHSAGTVDRTQTDTDTTGAKAFLAALLNGALLGLPDGVGNSTEFDPTTLQFARFTTLSVTSNGNDLAWDGKASLEIADGKVTGAHPLIGFGPFQMPWWSYVLWLAALTVFIVRLVRKPDKSHPRWDRFKWVGWVAGPLAWILVFLLWDAEVHAVLGSSLLRDATGQARLVIGLVEFALLSLVAFIAAAPLRILLRNSSLLAHQGTFMGLAGAVSALLGFLFGATYLRAYLGLILDQVMQRLA